MAFSYRIDAGRRLAKELAPYKAKKPVVLALPRGGVPVAAEIAAALDAPLNVALVRKIRMPNQPELAAGAVTDGRTAVIVPNEDVIRLAKVSEADFATACDQEFAEIERRRKLYLGSRPPTSLDVPALDCAYKLQEYSGLARRKHSAGKATWPAGSRCGAVIAPTDGCAATSCRSTATHSRVRR